LELVVIDEVGEYSAINICDTEIGNQYGHIRFRR
jgi:hypothetical protein